MTRIAFFLAVLCVSASFAQAPELTVSSTFAWPGRLEVRGSVSAGDSVVAFSCTDAVQDLRLTVDLPWVAVGPLVPRGVLRLAGNPLGFSPRSDAFRERTGLSVDTDHDDKDPGVVCMPVPGSLGLFAAPAAAGGIIAGCWSTMPVGDGAFLDAAASFARPDGESFVDPWYTDEAPYPGGALLNTAGRLVVDASPFGLSAAAGCSLGELTSPGAFVVLQLSGGGEATGASLLLGRAQRAYRTPAGSAAGNAWQAASAMRLSRGRGSLDLQVAGVVSPDGFAPHPFIATRESVILRLTQVFDAPGQSKITTREEAAKRIEMDVEGNRAEEMRWQILARAEAGKASASAGWSWSDASGAGLSFSLSVTPWKSLRGEVDVRARPLDTGGVSLSAEGALRLTTAGGSYSLTAGWGEAGRITLELGWTVRSRTGRAAGSDPLSPRSLPFAPFH